MLAATTMAMSAAALAGPCAGFTDVDDADGFCPNVEWIKNRAITLGSKHSCALTSGGGVKCWGDNFQGQLGIGTSFGQSGYPVDVIGLSSGVVAITAGSLHTCALTSAGAVTCWGNDYYGQLGGGLATGFVAITAGYHHTCGLTVGGGVKCWGANYGGQLGDGSTATSAVPVNVSGLDSGVIAIAAGAVHSCAIVTGGGVKCWGTNDGGQLGNGTTVNSFTPVDVSGLGSEATALALGAYHSCAIAGGVKCWGYNGSGQLGNDASTNALVPIDVVGLAGGATAIASSNLHTCALAPGGAPRCWGSNWSGQLGDSHSSTVPLAVDVIGASGLVAIATGEDHSCALTGVGGVKCWGRNFSGALGNGTTEDSFLPVDVAGLGPATAVRAGGYTSCAVTASGGVKCWGLQLLGAQLLPADVPGLASGVMDITIGNGHACALLDSGTVKCWGSNSYGQLGNGIPGDSPAPVDVAGLGPDVVSIGAGRSHTCAVFANGGIKCWGDNTWLQLGNGGPVMFATPVNVEGLSFAMVAVDGGDSHSCARSSDYRMECWGSNGSAQLGFGHHPGSLPPIPTPLATGTFAVATGASHSCQLGGGGSVRCWGASGYGQIGIGPVGTIANPAAFPAEVPGVSGARDVATSSNHTCALLNDGTVKCWGWNTFGQIGNGFGGYARLPVAALVSTCGGFDDVVAGNPFCANVAWSRNRLVTQGCAANLYCPDAQVLRVAMAAFVSRLGDALTPDIRVQQSETGTIDPDANVVVCMTSEHATGSQRRRYHLDAVMSLLASTDTQFRAHFVWKYDNYPFWLYENIDVSPSVARAGRWTNLRKLSHVDVEEGRTVVFGIEVGRRPATGVGTISQGTCNLRVRIENRNGPAPPF